VSWIGPLAALLTGVALLGAIAPFTRASRARLQRLTSQQEDDRLRLLRALRDLERDRDRGALSQAEYGRLRQRAEAEAVALIRDLGGRERSGELAAALRTPRRRARGTHRAAPGPAVLVAMLVAVAGVATTVPLLLGAAGTRPAGGFITGTQATPTSAPPVTGLEQHVRDHPGDLEARLDLAQTYLEAGRPRQASQQYVEVLKRDPDNPQATTRLALLLYEAGDTDDALKGANKVLATHADYPEALFLQGVILLNALNRPKDAIAPLQRYLQVAPDGGYRDDAQQLLQEARAQAG
jgi:cytochrome c-type biogenesis protein CcmH/NrfG